MKTLIGMMENQFNQKRKKNQEVINQTPLLYVFFYKLRTYQATISIMLACPYLIKLQQRPKALFVAQY